MALFRYEAVDRVGQVVCGAMNAQSEADVNTRLHEMGYQARAIQSSPSQGGSTRTVPVQHRRSWPFRLRRPSAKNQALFYRQFAALVRSGISFYQALENLAPRTADPLLRQAAQEMAEAARGGEPISTVMEQYPDGFAPHVIGTMRAAELGGFVPIALDQIAQDFEQEIAFYKGAWLAQTVAWQAVFALAIGQPLFPNLFPHFQPTVYLKFVLFRNLPIAFALFMLSKGFVAWLNRPSNRERKDAWALRAPVFGDLARQRSLFAFIDMLRRLYTSGIDPTTAWEGAMNVAPNAAIRKRLQQSATMMRSDVPLHEAFTATHLFANETEQLLATGVVSGQVVEMMDRIADYYHNNVDQAFRGSRFTMFRIGFLVMLIVGGALLILLTKTYFDSVFAFPHWFMPEAD